MLVLLPLDVLGALDFSARLLSLPPASALRYDLAVCLFGSAKLL
jgi:hypothetical protein